MIVETISEIFTDFQKSLRYTELCRKSCQADRVNPCWPGYSEYRSKLYAATIAIGTTKKTTSQATGGPSRVGVVRSSRRRLGRVSRAGDSPAWVIAIRLDLTPAQDAFTSSHILA